MPAALNSTAQAGVAIDIKMIIAASALNAIFTLFLTPNAISDGFGTGNAGSGGVMVIANVA